MDKITEIELMNGETVAVNCRLSLVKWKQHINNGVFSQSAFQQMLSAQEAKINEKDLYAAPWVAYENAGGTMSRQDFDAQLPMDAEIFGGIYGQIINGGKVPKKD